MPIYKDGNKIGSIYYGTNKIGKVYEGTTLVYQSRSRIPGTMYADLRSTYGITAQYALYDSSGNQIYKGTSAVSADVMKQAVYYENLSNNTTPCFRAFPKDNKDTFILFGYFGAYGTSLGASNYYADYKDAPLNTTAIVNNISKLESWSAMKTLYNMKINGDSVFGYKDWLWGGRWDEQQIVEVFKYVTNDDLHAAGSYKNIGTNENYNDPTNTILCFYLESSQWKSRSIYKSNDNVSNQMNYFVVSQFC